MHLNLIWLLSGLTAAAAVNSLALSSDYLGVTLPFLSLAFAVVIVLIGSRTAGTGFFQAMVIPAGLGVFYLFDQPLPGMVAMPLILGVWLGLANRLLAVPTSILGLIGQTGPIVSAGLLFWRHLGVSPIWTLAGLLCYSVLSTRPSGRRVLSCC